MIIKIPAFNIQGKNNIYQFPPCTVEIENRNNRYIAKIKERYKHPCVIDYAANQIIGNCEHITKEKAISQSLNELFYGRGRLPCRSLESTCFDEYKVSTDLKQVCFYPKIEFIE